MIVELLPDLRPAPTSWAPDPALVAAVMAPTPPSLTTQEPTRRVDPGAASLVTAMVEVVNGRRAASQLARWASEEVVAELAARARSRQEPVVVRSLRMQCDGPRAELAARLQQGRRQRALAVALRRQGQRWVCTDAVWG